MGRSKRRVKAMARRSRSNENAPPDAPNRVALKATTATFEMSSPRESPAPTSGPASNDEQLRFWTSHLNQVHSEVLQLLSEMTRYMHLKLLFFASLLLLAAGTGRLGVLILALMPLALHTFDVMQGHRMGLICNRWDFLDQSVRPELKKLLHEEIELFASRVMERERAGHYGRPHNRARTLIMMPVVTLASISSGALAFSLSLHALVAHAVAVAWAVGLTICLYQSRLYERSVATVPVLVSLALLGVDLLQDHCVYETVATQMSASQFSVPALKAPDE